MALTVLGLGLLVSSTTATSLRLSAPANGLWPNGDWPQFGRTPAFLSYNDVATAPKHKEWVWQSTDKMIASPSVAGGRIYIGSDDGYLYCLNQSTGNVLWKFLTTPRGLLGIRSTPAVHADLSVTFGSYNGNVYHVSASGEMVWKYDTGNKVYSSVSIDEDGTVFAGNYGPPGNCVYAIDGSNGRLKWKACGESQGAMNSGAAWAPDGDVLVMNNFDGHVRGIDKSTGAIKWTFVTGSPSDSSAVMVGDTAFIGSWSKSIYALDANTGAKKWSFDTGGEIESHAAYHDGVVCVPATPKGSVFVKDCIYYVTAEESCAIYALNATTGDVLWKRVNIAAQEINSSPSLTDKYIYFGANDGVMYALDRLTGADKFTFKACDNHIFSSPAIADNGMIYFVCGDDSETPIGAPNKLFALDPSLHGL